MQDIEMQSTVTAERQATSTTKKAMTVVLSLCLGLALFVAMTSTDAQSSLPAATELAIQSSATQLAGGFKCVDPWKRCTDYWCNINCNNNPSYCPRSYCRGVATPPAPPAPANSEPTDGCGKDADGQQSLLGVSYFNDKGVNTGKPFKQICCPAKCGECGGEACGDRPGGANACCGKKIVAPSGQKACSEYKAGEKGGFGCVLGDPAAATELAAAATSLASKLPALPTQLAGVIAGYYKCIDKYGRCTDKWCNDNCNHVGASFCPPSYCKANSDDTEESKAAGGCTGGSIEGNIAKKFGGGKVCCPAGCGSCGGKGCANRPGGKSECCVGDGKTYGVSASAACGTAPCKLAAATSLAADATTELLHSSRRRRRRRTPGSKCASEHGSCHCVGTVSYGTEGRYSQANVNGVIKCDNDGVFGDPYRGKTKACYCKN